MHQLAVGRALDPCVTLLKQSLLRVNVIERDHEAGHLHLACLNLAQNVLVVSGHGVLGRGWVAQLGQLVSHGFDLLEPGCTLGCKAVFALLVLLLPLGLALLTVGRVGRKTGVDALVLLGVLLGLQSLGPLWVVLCPAPLGLPLALLGGLGLGDLCGLLGLDLRTHLADALDGLCSPVSC